jgi:hypothetical protein
MAAVLGTSPLAATGAIAPVSGGGGRFMPAFTGDCAGQRAMAQRFELRPLRSLIFLAGIGRATRRKR